jgi:hypothetical protein
MMTMQCNLSHSNAFHHQSRQVRIRLAMDDHCVLDLLSSLPYRHGSHWSLRTCKAGQQIFFLEPYQSDMKHLRY